MTAGNNRPVSSADRTPSAQAEPTELDDAAFAAHSDTNGFVTRRKVFAVGSAGALTMSLAACGVLKSGDDTSAVSSAGAADASASAAADAGDGGDDSSGGAGKAKTEVVTLAALADVPVGGAIGVKVGGKPYIVAQPTEGKVACWSAVCPHQGCTVPASGTKTMTCPCHGSTFDPKTGKNISGPADGKPLPKVKVKLSKKGKVNLV
jgi:nitrite reductase/ring-hydroxylating ferredoxin subunit